MVTLVIMMGKTTAAVVVMVIMTVGAHNARIAREDDVNKHIGEELVHCISN